MKSNIIGIVGAVIAFISLAFPWWTMTLRQSRITSMGYNGVRDVSIYPYQATASADGSVAVNVGLWYGWVTFVLVIMGGLLGIASSVTQSPRVMLFGGGLLTVFSIAIFATGLQVELSKSAVIPGYPAVGLFSSGSGFLGYVSYATYLSYGFWLASVAAIVMLVALRRKVEISAGTSIRPAPM